MTLQRLFQSLLRGICFDKAVQKVFFWQSRRNFLWHMSYFNCRNKTTYIKHPSVMNIDINNKWNQHNWSLIFKASQVASTLIPTINELNMIDSWYIKHNQVAWTLTSTINEIDTIDPWYLKHHKWHELWDYTRRKNTSNCKRASWRGPISIFFPH